MQAPNTIEGFLTEAIMARVTKKLGLMPAHQYNPMWSAVLETLQDHLPAIIEQKRPLSRKEFLELAG